MALTILECVLGLTTVLGLLSQVWEYLWQLLALPLRCLGFQSKEIVEPSFLASMKAHLGGSSLETTDGTPRGFVWGKWYIGYISTTEGGRGGTNVKLRVIAKKEWFKQVVSMSKTDDGEEVEQPTTILMPNGRSGFDFGYNESKCLLSTPSPDLYTNEQRTLLDNITKVHLTKKNKNVVVFLHGEPGTGKSSIAYALADKLGEACKLVLGWDPIGLNHHFTSCFASKQDGKTLIFAVEEIDVILRKIHEDKARIQSDFFTQPIFNKSSWNSFLDYIDRGVFRNCIFVLTSNTSLEDINAMDLSFLRKGRVDITAQLTEKVLEQVCESKEDMCVSGNSKKLDIRITIDQLSRKEQ